MQGVFYGVGDLGGVYSKAHWQIYNKKLSEPFENSTMNPK
jgi:outer membrane phospholipase A